MTFVDETRDVAAGYIEDDSPPSHSMGRGVSSTPRGAGDLSGISHLQTFSSPSRSRYSEEPTSSQMIQDTSAVAESESNVKADSRSFRSSTHHPKLHDFNEAFLLLHFQKVIGPCVCQYHFQCGKLTELTVSSSTCVIRRGILLSMLLDEHHLAPYCATHVLQYQRAIYLVLQTTVHLQLILIMNEPCNCSSLCWMIHTLMSTLTFCSLPLSFSDFSNNFHVSQSDLGALH